MKPATYEFNEYETLRVELLSLSVRELREECLQRGLLSNFSETDRESELKRAAAMSPQNQKEHWAGFLAHLRLGENARYDWPPALNLQQRDARLLASLLAEHLNGDEATRDDAALALRFHEFLITDGGYPSPWDKHAIKAIKQLAEG